jgi:hypothetical protein
VLFNLENHDGRFWSEYLALTRPRFFHRKVSPFDCMSHRIRELIRSMAMV